MAHSLGEPAESMEKSAKRAVAVVLSLSQVPAHPRGLKGFSGLALALGFLGLHVQRLVQSPTGPGSLYLGPLRAREIAARQYREGPLDPAVPSAWKTNSLSLRIAVLRKLG